MKKYIISALCLLLLASCSRSTNVDRAPIYDITEKDVYIVRSGDSLYSIAWLYNLDYMELAKENKLKPPYSVAVGQRISLSKGKHQSVKTKQVSYPKLSKGSGIKKISWKWPVASRTFKASAVFGAARGIDISAKYKDNIYSAASGTVVYNGSGIKGYGNLIIIKHSNSVLTAYGYSAKSFVKENQKVRRGQKIALVGKDLNGKAVLHFEIRENGKPVNPVKVFPNYRHA